MTVRDGLVLVPMLLAVIALALYPQFALKRGERRQSPDHWPRPSSSQKQQQVVAASAARKDGAP